jgi:cytidylate kinase
VTATGFETAPPLVIVIGGPIASGKSTLASRLGRAFEERTLAATAIDLDLIYEMVDHSQSAKDDAATWSRARRIAGRLTNALLEDGFDIVIAEGDFLEDSARRELVSLLPDVVPVRFVTLRVGLATALARVQQDPTRGLSRDRAFLTRHYEELAATLDARPEHDLCLDTEALTVEQAADAIVQWSSGPAAA